MQTYVPRTIALAAAALLFGTAAMAQGRSDDHGRSDSHGRDGKSEIVRDANGNVVGAPNRDGDRRDVPPGLAKKPEHMPPGQYKKHYTPSDGAGVLGDILRTRGYTVTRVTSAGTSRYVYYRLRNGREQRAIVRPGTGRPSFSNVPSSLLEQVLSKLR